MEKLKQIKTPLGEVVVDPNGAILVETFTPLEDKQYSFRKSCVNKFMKGEGDGFLKRYFRRRHYWKYYTWCGYRIVKMRFVEVGDPVKLEE